MGASEEAVVRLFYEAMANARKNELADDLFTDDHVFHDPQIEAPPGPQGVADTVSVYQQNLEGHWAIEEISETWEVWDTLGMLQQLGVVPAG